MHKMCLSIYLSRFSVCILSFASLSLTLPLLLIYICTHIKSTRWWVCERDTHRVNRHTDQAENIISCWYDENEMCWDLLSAGAAIGHCFRPRRVPFRGFFKSSSYTELQQLPPVSQNQHNILSQLSLKVSLQRVECVALACFCRCRCRY